MVVTAPRLAHRRPHLPLGRFPGFGLDLLRGRKRSFLDDGQAMLARIDHRWEGLERVPADGPLCLVANHYQRPDLWIGWAGALLSVAVARRRHGQTPHWLVLGDFHFRVGRWRLPLPGARATFHAVARAWDFVPTTGLENPAERSAALRALLRWTDRGEPIGLFPEGAGGRAGVPGPALPGVGRFLALLARRGVSVVPARVGEEGEVFVARFGAPVRGLDVEPDDDAAGHMVMGAIAALGPMGEDR